MDLYRPWIAHLARNRMLTLRDLDASQRKPVRPYIVGRLVGGPAPKTCRVELLADEWGHPVEPAAIIDDETHAGIYEYAGWSEPLPGRFLQTYVWKSHESRPRPGAAPEIPRPLATHDQPREDADDWGDLAAFRAAAGASRPPRPAAARTGSANPAKTQSRNVGREPRPARKRRLASPDRGCDRAGAALSRCGSGAPVRLDLYRRSSCSGLNRADT